MRVGHRNLTSTLMLLLLSDVLCSRRKQQHICAVKGSSVVIPCSFYLPAKHKARSVMWGHERFDIHKGPFIFDSEFRNNSSRFQYIGDKHHNCSLKINHVEHNDAGKYNFSLRTDKRGIWTQRSGSTLKVVDLNISVTKPHGTETMKEGESVNLTCINICDGVNVSSAFTWFKNGDPIKEGPVFYLSNMSSESSGNYTCSLKTQTETTSRVMNIDVELYCSTFTRDVLIIATVSVLLIVTTVIAIIRLKRKGNAAPKTECEEDVQNAVYANWPMFDINQSQEGNQFEGGTQDLIYTAVEFNTKRKSNMEQQMDSHTDEGVIYSTVCRYQLLDPSYIEPL